MDIVKNRRRNDERGMEATAMIFVIPVLVVLIMALIDVGMMFRARMIVENISRDAVRNAAADGGLNNSHTNTHGAWDQYALNRLYTNHRCTVGACKEGEVPTINCWMELADGTGHYIGGKVQHAGDIISCKVHYPYKPINGPLLNGPIGLGMGSLLKEFDVEVSARSETGVQAEFGGTQ